MTESRATFMRRCRTSQGHHRSRSSATGVDLMARVSRIMILTAGGNRSISNNVSYAYRGRTRASAVIALE